VSQQRARRRPIRENGVDRPFRNEPRAQSGGVGQLLPDRAESARVCGTPQVEAADAAKPVDRLSVFSRRGRHRLATLLVIRRVIASGAAKLREDDHR
jgi:hypothetical protein